jgi:hypothetical protein
MHVAQKGRQTELDGWYLVSFIVEKHFIKKLDKDIGSWCHTNCQQIDFLFTNRDIAFLWELQFVELVLYTRQTECKKEVNWSQLLGVSPTTSQCSPQAPNTYFWLVTHFRSWTLIPIATFGNDRKKLTRPLRFKVSIENLCPLYGFRLYIFV